MDNHPIPELDRAGLRRFGLTTAALLALLFGLLLPWLFGAHWPLWPWVVGGILTFWALAAPSSLKPVYRVWMHFGLFIGGIMNRLILGLVFFAVMLPMGWLMRLSGRDPLARDIDPKAANYRVPSRERAPSSMERPF